MLKQRLSAWMAVIALAGAASVLATCSSGGQQGTPPASPKPNNKAPIEIGQPTISSLRSAPNFGTLVRFEKSADAAFVRAMLEGKLVLILQLSGDFASSETT